MSETVTPREPRTMTEVPRYDLSQLSPSIRDRISESTPYRFHCPFPETDPTFVEPFIPLEISSILPSQENPHIPSPRSDSDSSTTSDSTSTTTTTTARPSRIDLVLTPQRPRDFDRLEECLNDPEVGLQLIGPPYPYTRAMATDWAEMRWRDTQLCFERLSREHDDEGRHAGGAETRFWPDGIPFSSIRNRDDGGEWIGEVGIVRWEFRDIEDEVERDTQQRLNRERRIGDKDLVWSFGYFISPKYQRSGIMTRALQAIFETILIGYLDAHVVRASAFADNEASIRVQEKCGLKKIMLDGKEKRFWHQVDESRGGGRREEVVLEWRRKVD